MSEVNRGELVALADKLQKHLDDILYKFPFWPKTRILVEPNLQEGSITFKSLKQ